MYSPPLFRGWVLSQFSPPLFRGGVLSQFSPPLFMGGVLSQFSPPLFRGGVRGGVNRQWLYRFKPDKLQQVCCDANSIGKKETLGGFDAPRDYG